MSSQDYPLTRSFRSAVQSVLGCFAVWIIFLALLPGGAAAAEYRLGPQDKIRIKVAEWRAGKSEYFDWAILMGEYTVNASGSIALPLLGNLPVKGLTVDELARLVAETLQTRAGIPNRPEAAVEIIQYRPIYVVGSVQQPGEYAYRPALTVLQAIGLSGGLYRQTESGLIRLERDRVSAIGAYESARLEIRRLLVRRERLTTELASGPQIPTPDDLRDDPDAPRLIADEIAVMNARSDALRSQLAANAEIKDLFSKEIVSLEQKVTAQERQIAIARRELQTVGNLVEKGLAVSSREFALERTLADLESKMLDYTTAILRARQEISKADRDATDLQADRKAKIEAERQETEAAIDQLRSRLATSQSLINEATTTAPRLLMERMEATRQITFWIVRQSDTNSIRISADADTAVEPGDVIQVEQSTTADTRAEWPDRNAVSMDSNMQSRSKSN
ncbi:polysaccharide biosynthesis/export family protein [Microvirga calopogonii]|uniref:polysaccharide biosynthesis/export family protein n=1 Tax=Microvirga calopogonii TaxID=2078013 RepID=UPI000E0DB22C|nr:polysaccharide biosynthesis/export family protein [Microvirga calopogonii]